MALFAAALQSQRARESTGRVHSSSAFHYSQSDRSQTSEQHILVSTQFTVDPPPPRRVQAICV
eukprot:6118874-Pyramimonas_sp.AAC.1